MKFSEGMRLIKCFWRFFSYKTIMVSFNCLRSWWRESYLLDDVIDGRVSIFEVLGEHL